VVIRGNTPDFQIPKPRFKVCGQARGLKIEKKSFTDTMTR